MSGIVESILGNQPAYASQRVATSWSDIQDQHDNLVSMGGGTLVFARSGNFTPSSSDSGITLNLNYVNVDFNGNRIDVSGLSAGTVAFTVYGSEDIHDYTRRNKGRWLRNGDIVAGDTSTSYSATEGVTGILFDSTTDQTANRLQLYSVNVYGGYKAVAFKSRSYFVRWYDSHIENARYGLYQESGASDFAEKIVFISCVIAENGTQLYDHTGNMWTFYGCSLDYHESVLADLAGGAKVWLRDCHIEFSYGYQSGQTNSPVQLAGANTSFLMFGGTLYYNDLQGSPTYNPYWASFATTDNASQHLVIEVERMVNMGRRNETDSFDALCISSSSVNPVVVMRSWPAGTSKNDMPAITHVSEGYGVFGQMRDGVSNIYNELSHRIALTGTAAISSVSADENGVTRKNSKNMLKITGQGKVIISLPYYEPHRRHGWVLFTNPAYLTGSVTIKERQTGFAPKFDGSTVTWAADTRGAVYSGTTVTISAGSNAWSRTSWKDCNTQYQPQPRQNVGGCIMIEIDTASMSAGALYLSHFGFDLI